MQPGTEALPLQNVHINVFACIAEDIPIKIKFNLKL